MLLNLAQFCGEAGGKANLVSCEDSGAGGSLLEPAVDGAELVGLLGEELDGNPADKGGPDDMYSEVKAWLTRPPASLTHLGLWPGLMSTIAKGLSSGFKEAGGLVCVGEVKADLGEGFAGNGAGIRSE